jgi:5-oxoprolinase (ATP-hydrolysing)
VWVDTGGTFTDCIAFAPDGSLRRAKVLSNSALRGVIVGQEGAQALRVQQQWDAPPNFIRGLSLTLLDGSDRTATVAGFNPVDGHIQLAESLPDVVRGTAFEVAFPEEPPVVAARLVTRTPVGESLPPLALRLATTRGTNALLTRRGVPPAFFVTAGFADLLEIGTQQRPDLFALDIQKPLPLYGEVVEVNERLDASGEVLRALDEEALSAAARRLVAAGITTAAVALLHSYRNPAHEQRVAEILHDAGFTDVSLSSQLSPFIKAVPRAETAVVNAYLSPIIAAYLDGVRSALSPETTLHIMTSAGGLVGAETFQPKDSLLSGPAGGIVGAARAGESAGFAKILAFDMGGTSTDVARFDGAFDYAWEHRVGDARLVAPALAIESVAAGGGSICAYDHQGLRVGPESAGASPGPACYGAGGPLTLTDVNLLLGRILPDRFEIPLLPEKARDAADALVMTLPADTDGATTAPGAILEGLLDIANERMADAIRRVSVRQGYDPTEYALLSFGGAGGQHACAVAARLGVRTVLVPPDASLLSAWGIGQASIERFAERQVLRLLDSDSEAEVIHLLSELGDEAVNAVAAEGAARDSVTVQRRIINLRLAGQETAQSIEFDETVPLSEAFARRFETVFGYPPPSDRSVEVESVRVVAAAPPIRLDTEVHSREGRTPEPQTVKARFAGQWQMVPLYERDSLRVGGAISGPALIAERHSITVVETGWQCRLHSNGTLILTHPTADTDTTIRTAATIEAVASELFAARFAAIAEEMGEKIRQNSISTNVKERLDFSCALLGLDGALISTAAHIPVHLGALGACVRRLREMISMQPGDVIITNHPGCGGSHLPDVTVVTPVFDSESRLLGYVANRAHHAEIGGTRPGSMPPRATTLREEGVVLSPTYLVRAGESCLNEVCHLLETAPYPSRAVADNRADLEAALAANRRGATALIELAAKHGAETVWRYMDTLTGRAERLLRHALAALPDGEYTATEYLDDGTPLAVTITIVGDAATVDFTGTGPTHPGNLNATPAIAASATLYVLRLLVGESLPLNEGLLRPITLVLPEDTLVNPAFDLSDPARCPAVVGGNTETSQRLVDTLMKALGLAAGSQGTMNNVLWGTDAFGYYETVCGGAGATPNAPGAHAVHTHMTNTRITDVEIVERRYPVRVERFAIRHGSGGAGQHQGGDGIVRETTFLAPMALSVLTQRRTSGPYGMAVGENGQPGRQRILRADGTVLELAPVDGCDVGPGDRLLLETPGGGGWGREPQS